MKSRDTVMLSDSYCVGILVIFVNPVVTLMQTTTRTREQLYLPIQYLRRATRFRRENASTRYFFTISRELAEKAKTNRVFLHSGLYQNVNNARI